MYFLSRHSAAASFSAHTQLKNFENFSKILKNFQTPATSYIEFWPKILTKKNWVKITVRCEQTDPEGQFAKRHAPAQWPALVKTDHTDQIFGLIRFDQIWSWSDLIEAKSLRSDLIVALFGQKCRGTAFLAKSAQKCFKHFCAFFFGKMQFFYTFWPKVQKVQCTFLVLCRYLHGKVPAKCTKCIFASPPLRRRGTSLPSKRERVPLFLRKGTSSS